MPKVKFPKGVLVHVNEKGWMDEDACKLWVRKIWQNRPGGLHRRKSLLVWDRFSAHLTEGVTKAVSASVVPGLNPLRVTVFRKSKLRALKWHKPDLSIFISNQVIPF